MIRKILLPLLVLTFVPSLFALDPVKLGGPPIHPKYLIPVNPQDRQYEEGIEKLLGSRWGKGTMICTDSPYSGGDFVISVWGKGSSNHNSDQALHNFITFIEVARGGTGHAVKKKDIDVAIDSELATAVQRAWATMLLKTRFPAGRYLGADGWQTEFSVWIRGLGGVYAQLWSPSEGLPKELMDIGFGLADYCRAPEAERTEKRKKLMQWLNDFATRAAAS